ncbi:MAG: aminotransferase class V-fold PLP-dependent enzyme [Planctomycetota bacterium]
MNASDRTQRTRIYLDHASTSWPKRPGVVEAMTRYLVDNGANAGRGGYESARAASAMVERVRHDLARSIAAPMDACVSFHGGCTAALNAAIHGVCGPEGLVDRGHHVIASAVEHNAVLRPLHAACRQAEATLQIASCDSDSVCSMESIANCIRAETRLVAMASASNVTGCVQPIAEVAGLLRDINERRPTSERIRLLCDAAQTLGYLPINVVAMGIDLLAAPAHKGMGGPSGIGMLYVAPETANKVRPVMQGGTGHDGRAWEMPSSMPHRMEAGTLNLPAIAGWEAALASVVEDGETEAHREASLVSLAKRMHEGVSAIPGLRAHSVGGVLPVVSVSVADADLGIGVHEIAAILDADFGVEVRAGHHCATAIHDHLGTQDSGTLRLSAGHGTRTHEIDHALDALSEIMASVRV